MNDVLRALAEPETRSDPSALQRVDTVLDELRGPDYPTNIRVKADRLVRTFSQWLVTQSPDAELLKSRSGRQLHIRLYQLCGALAAFSRNSPRFNPERRADP